MLKVLALTSATFVALSTGGTTGYAPADPVRRPNILIIVTDDQRAGEGTLRVMPRTRHWLMENGTRFPNAVSTTPLCCPARASIFSGRYAHNHGVFTNLGELTFRHKFTVQHYLSRAGYRTALAGKFFNNWDLDRPPPYFDRWAMFDGGYYNRTFNIDGTMRTTSRYSTDYMSDKSEGMLRDFEENDGQPWFLYVAPYGPHAPFTPARRHRNAEVPYWNGNPAVFETNRSDKPDYVRLREETYKTWRGNRRKQLRSLMSVDDLVGRIRRTILDLGESRNTLVFYLSDNGYMWADHGLYDKGAPYTPSVRIPFLLSYPATPSLAPVDTRLVGNIDLAPTILDAAGISQAAQHPMDGKSLFNQNWNRERILAEYRNSDNRWTPPTWASTRTRDFQYTEYYDNGKRIFREYYDLERDPWQLRNRLGDGKRSNDPPSLKLMSEQLAADRRCSGNACP